MVDADEETALLPGPAARDAVGREEPPRRRGRVIAFFVLVLVGALALVAAAGRGAADSETHVLAGLFGGGAANSGPRSPSSYEPPLGTENKLGEPQKKHWVGSESPTVSMDGGYEEPHQISPLNGPPASNYFHKDPNYAPVTSFFAKILSRPTRVLEMAMGLGKEKGLDIVGQKAETDINGQWYSQ